MSDVIERAAAAMANEYYSSPSYWAACCHKNTWRSIATLGAKVLLDEVRIAVLEQRCERGTPWDLAVLACAEAVAQVLPKSDKAEEAVAALLSSVSKYPPALPAAIVAAVRAADRSRQ